MPPPGTTVSTMVIARQLLRLRRAIAPAGSRREAILRAIYLPLINHMQRRELLRFGRDALEPRVVTIPNLHTKVAAWPSRPRILVLKLDHMGDFIVALPALEQLRAAFPHALITLVCGPWNQVWAERSGLADAVMAFDFFAKSKAEWQGARPEHFVRFGALDLGSFDLAVDLRHDPDTRPLLARVDASIRMGFAAPLDLDGSCMDLALPNMEHVEVAAGSGRPLLAGLRLEVLVSAVIAALTPPSHPARMLVDSDKVRTLDRRFAVLAPGAGSPIRIWPIERLAEVGRMLIERHDFDILLIGGPDQVTDCSAIASMLPAGRVRNTAGKVGIPDLPALVAGASLLVGYDTGTSHLAASLGVPTVSVMGGIADPEVWRVDGTRAVAIASEIACSHCYLTHVAECAFGVRCMTAITSDHVMAACESLLVRQMAEMATSD
jgi:ADP-heptose:LPS heptosyltransferase